MKKLFLVLGLCFTAYPLFAYKTEDVLALMGKVNKRQNPRERIVVTGGDFSGYEFHNLGYVTFVKANLEGTIFHSPVLLGFESCQGNALFEK